MFVTSLANIFRYKVFYNFYRLIWQAKNTFKTILTKKKFEFSDMRRCCENFPHFPVGGGWDI